MKSDGFGIMYESDSCFSFGRFAFGVYNTMRRAKSDLSVETPPHAAYFVVDTRSTENMPKSTLNLADKCRTQDFPVGIGGHILISHEIF